MDQLSFEEKRKVVEWSLSFCDLEKTAPFEHKYKFRSLDKQIRAELEEYLLDKNQALISYRMTSFWIETTLA